MVYDATLMSARNPRLLCRRYMLHSDIGVMLLYTHGTNHSVTLYTVQSVSVVCVCGVCLWCVSVVCVRDVCPWCVSVAYVHGVCVQSSVHAIPCWCKSTIAICCLCSFDVEWALELHANIARYWCHLSQVMSFRVVHFDEDPQCGLQACGCSASIRVTPTATRRYVLPSQQMAAVSSVDLMMDMCTSGAQTAQSLLLRQEAKRYAAVTLNIDGSCKMASSSQYQTMQCTVIVLWCIVQCNCCCNCQALRLNVRPQFVLPWTPAVDTQTA